MEAKTRSSIKVNFRRLCDELKKPEPNIGKLSDAIQALRDDKVDYNLHYLLGKPYIVQQLINFISKLEESGIVSNILALLNLIWEKCQTARKYVDPANLFVLNGPTGFRTVLMKWLVESPVRKNPLANMFALKCLSEALENELEVTWNDINTPLAMVRNLFMLNCEGKLTQNKMTWSKGNLPSDNGRSIGLIRIESAMLVNLCARANLELRGRITTEFRDQLMSLSKVATMQIFPEIAQNCCLIWHNLCYEDVNNAHCLNQTNAIVNATKSILTNFNPKDPSLFLARSAALLYIADVSALNMKTRLASAKELLRLVYGVLSKEYVNADALPVMACCKTLARLTFSDDECKYELIDLLDNTCKSKDGLVLMMVLVRWKDYENIVRYVLEICDNISLHESSLLQQNEKYAFTLVLERIIYTYALVDHKIGYAARRLLLAIELKAPEKPEMV